MNSLVNTGILKYLLETNIITPYLSSLLYVLRGRILKLAKPRLSHSNLGAKHLYIESGFFRCLYFVLMFLVLCTSSSINHMPRNHKVSLSGAKRVQYLYVIVCIWWTTTNCFRRWPLQTKKNRTWSVYLCVIIHSALGFRFDICIWVYGYVAIWLRVGGDFFTWPSSGSGSGLHLSFWFVARPVGHAFGFELLMGVLRRLMWWAMGQGEFCRWLLSLVMLMSSLSARSFTFTPLYSPVFFFCGGDCVLMCVCCVWGGESLRLSGTEKSNNVHHSPFLGFPPFAALRSIGHFAMLYRSISVRYALVRFLFGCIARL